MTTLTSSGSGSVVGGGGDGGNKSTEKKLHLDLDNFDRDDVPEDCPYVITSPRSLEACKRLGVKVSKEKSLSRRRQSRRVSAAAGSTRCWDGAIIAVVFPPRIARGWRLRDVHSIVYNVDVVCGVYVVLFPLSVMLCRASATTRFDGLSSPGIMSALESAAEGEGGLLRLHHHQEEGEGEARQDLPHGGGDPLGVVLYRINPI